jgi:MoxR-like ATPase
MQKTKNQSSPVMNFTQTSEIHEEVSFVPAKSSLFVKWGLFTHINKVISSQMFYPVFITGMTGIGKSEMVIQACAEKKRELIRINCTKNTGEEDFMGMYTLKEGSFVWEYGPVALAMKRGAIVLLDEIDTVSPEKAFSLQSVLEGKPVYLKKKNEMIHPQPGFNIIATANTKGRGAFDGRYVGTQIQNAAFLDRFAITMEQTYPTKSVETKILTKVYEQQNFENGIDKDFIARLVHWAYLIRESFKAGGCEEVISTRRLINIIKAYKIFEDKGKAVEYCINTFDDENKNAFMAFYSSIDDEVANGFTTEVSDED